MEWETEVVFVFELPVPILWISFHKATLPHNITTPIMRRVVRLIGFLPFMVNSPSVLIGFILFYGK
ncbi:hypothetical protein ASL11_04850 [Paenibacillus sp. Soil750]|nr:hypothetical protein ASL11_04850 [Paenibacillus sp. Soil750]